MNIHIYVQELGFKSIVFRRPCGTIDGYDQRGRPIQETLSDNIRCANNATVEGFGCSTPDTNYSNPADILRESFSNLVIIIFISK